MIPGYHPPATSSRGLSQYHPTVPFQGNICQTEALGQEYAAMAWRRSLLTGLGVGAAALVGLALAALLVWLCYRRQRTR